ncbi:MAG: ThuA domain-containing protein [Capsulimonadales bacterium]|nr:ThuA domain-containing protein [Capsulimonadales bacterium]
MSQPATAQPSALFIGGCVHPFHFLEPAIPSVRAVLESVGLTVEVSGIYHPKRFPGDAPAGVVAEETERIGDYSALNAESLARLALVALFTTGSGQGEDVTALLEWVRNGGALVGFHCAADSFQGNADYVAALGGLFRTHPAPLDIAVEWVDTEHPITAGLTPFQVRDELYLFNHYDPARVHLLAQTRSFAHYEDQPDAPVPVCWTRTEGKGRIFYLSLGHFPEVMADPNWQELVRRGALWALGR